MLSFPLWDLHDRLSGLGAASSPGHLHNPARLGPVFTRDLHVLRLEQLHHELLLHLSHLALDQDHILRTAL